MPRFNDPTSVKPLHLKISINLHLYNNYIIDYYYIQHATIHGPYGPSTLNKPYFCPR